MRSPSELRGRLVAAGCLAAVTGYHLALLFVQVRHPEPFLNDGVLHFGLIRALASAPERGQSFLDPWIPTWNLGFPVFHYYQNLPHLLAVGLWKLALGWLTLVRSFKIVEWLAVGTLPIPVYLALRHLGFARPGAVAAGTLVLWIRTNYLHGLDFESYVWQGLGQYAQAVGGWFLPLALAWTYRALRDGKGYGGAALLLALTFLAHLALGYMAFMAAGLFALLSVREIPRRLLRLALIAAVAIGAATYVVVPILKDFAFYNVSALVPSWKYNSFGHEIILGWLVRGELFDFGRLPVLTALCALGVVWTAARARRDEAARGLLVTFIFFLLLFFGRPTWGKLLHLIPLGSGFHYSRALFVVHLTGAMMAGLAAGWLLEKLWRQGALARVAAVVLAVLVAFPLARERTQYLLHNADLVRDAAAGYAAEGEDLEEALAFARKDRNGRVYAGLGRARRPDPSGRTPPPGDASWGGEFLVGDVPVYAWLPQREIDAVGYLHHMWSLNADLFAAFDERKPLHHQLFNVRRIIAPPGRELLIPTREIFRAGRFRVLETDAPGFLALADAPYCVNVSKRDLSRIQMTWLRSSLASAGVHPVVQLLEDGGPARDGLDTGGYSFRFPALESQPAPRGEVTAVERRGEGFSVLVRVNRPCHLLLKVSHHPGWKARVDGQAAKVIHLLPSFPSVQVDSGIHEVEFRYDPGSLKLILLAAGLLLLFLLFLTEKRLPF